jgi:hypothetical protein
MPKVERIPNTYWFQVRNDSDKPIRDVRLSYSRWGAGPKTLVVAQEMAPRELKMLSLARQNIKVEQISITHRRPDGLIVRSEIHQPDSNTYFRWAHVGISAGGKVGGLGRGYREHQPTLFWDSFSDSRASGPVLSDAEADSSEASEYGAATATQWFELVNASGRTIELVSVTFATEGEAMTVAVNERLRYLDHIDINLATDAVRVKGCKVTYRLDGTSRTDKLEFNNGWCLLSSVFVYGDDEMPLGHLTFAGSDNRAAQEDAQQTLVIEPDPVQQGPGCLGPMRIRNTSAHREVVAEYISSYEVSGPHQYCPPGVQLQSHKVTLPPNGTQYLGCSRYHTANSWCVEIRKWWAGTGLEFRLPQRENDTPDDARDAFSHESMDEALVAEPNGHWVHIKSIRFSDLQLIDNSDGAIAAKVTQRVGALRVWWNDGPQHYVALYAHSVTAVSAETDQFHIRLKWMNQGGGTEKVETITDHVSCRDVNRRGVWTFSITEAQAEHIMRGSADVFGPVLWRKCV